MKSKELMERKIKTIDELSDVLKQLKQEGKKIVHCHGVFDLLHPGYIRYFMEAKKEGDTLVVSLIPDKFVNKAIGRPKFEERQRLEQLASLSCIDYVVLGETRDAISLIKCLKPDFYITGDEDREGAIKEISCEVQVVKEASPIFTNPLSERLSTYIDRLKTKFSLKDAFDLLQQFSEKKVLVVGDAIINEFQYVNSLGYFGNGGHLSARCLDKEIFLDGALFVANLLAAFSEKVSLMTSVGENCAYLPFIKSHLKPNIIPHFYYAAGMSTLFKKRYLQKEGDKTSPLFETFSSTDFMLTAEQTLEAAKWLKQAASNFDLVLVCDFGNGMTNPLLIDALSSLKTFLAVNTQTNNGNKDFNVITHYHRANFISITESQLRLAAQDKISRLEAIVDDLSSLLNCEDISITHGVNGVYHYSRGDEFTIPSFSKQPIDSSVNYFCIAALALASHAPAELSTFLGAVAAAFDNESQQSFDKTEISKYVTRLYK